MSGSAARDRGRPSGTGFGGARIVGSGESTVTSTLRPAAEFQRIIAVLQRRPLKGCGGSMKRLIGKFVPQSLQNWALRRKDEDGLRQVPTVKFTVDNLISGSAVRLEEIWKKRETQSAWEKAEPLIRKFGVPDGTGGVNPGDRRALYYLVSHFQPGRMLEVGTHIGASTMHAPRPFRPSAVRRAAMKKSLSRSTSATSTIRCRSHGCNMERGILRRN